MGRRRVAVATGVARGIALFWGLLVLLDLLGRWLDPGFDAGTWWVDLRGWPALPALAMLGGLSALLLGFAVRPDASVARRRATAGVIALMAALMLRDGCRYLESWFAGRFRGAFPLPMSFVSAAMLAAMVPALAPAAAATRRHPRLAGAATAAALAGCLVAVPLAQMVCFGLTDYRRPAAAAVVFGARAYNGGALSNALADRVDAACELYRAGLVHKLVFSGGPGDGDVDEPEAMKRDAVRQGVAPRDIVLDHGGINTYATVANTASMLRALNGPVLAVSHFYHLPRVKMCYQAAGLDVYTVPARQQRLLRQLPWLVAREVLALWAYYLRALVGSVR